MKKFILICMATALAVNTSFAWGRLAHATVAKIAENHLSKKAKKQITAYLDGKSIVYYASYADDYKPELLLDTGFEPSNTTRLTTYPHTFEANDDCTVFRGTRKGDKFIKNCIYQTEQIAASLKANHKEMSDSVRMTAIALIVHFVGDMHCPEHMRFPEDQTIGYYKVKFGKEPLRYHSLWDTQIVATRNPWGYSDFARFLDTFDKKQIAEVTAGDLYDWGEDAARSSRHVHTVKEGDQLDKRLYLNEYQPLAESQIRKAGYRLAKVLNDVFR